jgi:hypothetical protein
MSQVALMLILEAVLTTNPPQDCRLSGTHAWNDQLINALPSCELVTVSPDGSVKLRIDSNGHISGTATTNLAISPEIKPVEAPAMLSWAPDSRAFFVNDGEGSGQTSVFRMFRISGDNIGEDFAIYRQAVAFFRNLKKCGSRSVDPDVWGFGWSPDGKRVYLLVQATLHDPCGRTGSFLTLVVNVADGKIIESLSESATKSRFQRLLPQAVLKGS